MPNTKYNQDSFLVITNCRSCNLPITKIKYHYLNEYETIYILGDCADYGENGNGKEGLDILFKIKELSEQFPGRVVYLPGNHDSIMYENCVSKTRNMYMDNMYNNRSSIMYEIEKLKEKDPEKLEELLEWLGQLPIQREHFQDGQRYVLAHALFNETLFQDNEDFSLDDYMKAGGIEGIYRHILWFRKGDNNYDKTTLPDKNSIMIIGHNTKHRRRDLNLDLENENNEKIIVLCVDSGTSYGRPILRFSGSSHTHHAFNGTHNNSTSKSRSKYNMNQTEEEKMFNKQIIKLIESSNSCKDAVVEFFKISIGVRNDVYGDIFDMLRSAELKEYMSNQILYYVTKNNAVQEDENDTTNKILYASIKEMFSKIALDYIIECLMKKYNDKSQYVEHDLKKYFTFKDPKFITETIGRARTIAKKFNPEDLIKVIRESEHPKIIDYINHEFGYTLKKQ